MDAVRRDDVLRAADGVADAHPGGPRAGTGSSLRECVGAGEPLNPEVIEQVQQAWGITIRDGFGQTETTAQIGNPPGQPVKPGSMGRPLPGYVVALVDPVTGEVGDDGRDLPRPRARVRSALMAGYRDDADRTDEAMRGGFYHTGDVASRDEDGYITYVGRADDVFKASDYRISPFELESVLIEHPAVAEAAVVPVARPGAAGGAQGVRRAGRRVTSRRREPRASTSSRYAREHLAPYKRIRRLEFAELPKTISGKIRRVELRARRAGSRRPVRATSTRGRLPGAQGASPLLSRFRYRRADDRPPWARRTAAAARRPPRRPVRADRRGPH